MVVVDLSRQAGRQQQQSVSCGFTTVSNVGAMMSSTTFLGPVQVGNDIDQIFTRRHRINRAPKTEAIGRQFFLIFLAVSHFRSRSELYPLISTEEPKISQQTREKRERERD